MSKASLSHGGGRDKRDATLGLRAEALPQLKSGQIKQEMVE